MARWYVPVTVAGRRRVVRVEAPDEWEAQSAASVAVDTDAFVRIDHALPAGASVCGWGCCTLRPPGRKRFEEGDE